MSPHFLRSQAPDASPQSSDVASQPSDADPQPCDVSPQVTAAGLQSCDVGLQATIADPQLSDVGPPRATWNKIEPLDRSDPTPHEISSEMKTRDGWRVAGASARGKLHAHRGLWREDSTSFDEVSTQNSEHFWSIVALSDGAGSAPLSRVGSRIVVESALAALKSSLETFSAFENEENEEFADKMREILVEAAQNALENLKTEAQNRQKPLSDFAATLLILVRCQWQNGQLCVSLQVGDGAIALYHDDETLTILGEADHGEHSSETRFLTTSGVEASLAERVKLAILPDLRAFAVMSDGVSDDFFPENPRLGEVFQSLLPVLGNAENGGAQILNWLKYEKKGSSDDRTLVLSWSNPNGEST